MTDPFSGFSLKCDDHLLNFSSGPKKSESQKKEAAPFPGKNRKRRFTSGFGISGLNFDQTPGFRNIFYSGKNGSSSDRSGVGVKVSTLQFCKQRKKVAAVKLI